MATIKRKWDRRQFLRAAGITGAAGALLPILPELGDARAAGEGPKRLLLVNTGNGTIINRWRQDDLVHGGALPALTSQVLAPLDGYRERMVFIDGLDMGAAYNDDLSEARINGHPDADADAGGHYAKTMLWTGRNGGGQYIDGPGSDDELWPDGPSIDHVIGAHIGADTAVGPMQLANWRRGDTSYDINGTKAPNVYDAGAAFDKAFEGAVSNDAELERRKARYGRSLDQLRGEIGRLQTQLPSADKERLAIHLENYDKFEARIRAAAACTVPNAPGDGLSHQDRADTMALLIQQAFACDRTRAINYCLYSDVKFGPAEATTFIPGVTMEAHDLSHATYNSDDACEQAAIIAEWQATQLAQLLDLLDAVEEAPGETMLDNTVVVWGMHMVHGGTHCSRATPSLIVTGKNGGFATNKYLRFGEYNPTLQGRNGNGTNFGQSFACMPNNHLLVSLCQAFGLEVDRFGDERFTGPLPGLEMTS